MFDIKFELDFKIPKRKWRGTVARIHQVIWSMMLEPKLELHVVARKVWGTPDTTTTQHRKVRDILFDYVMAGYVRVEHIGPDEYVFIPIDVREPTEEQEEYREKISQYEPILLQQSPTGRPVNLVKRPGLMPSKVL